jgi:hypothetical protein
VTRRLKLLKSCQARAALEASVKLAEMALHADCTARHGVFGRTAPEMAAWSIRQRCAMEYPGGQSIHRNERIKVNERAGNSSRTRGVETMKPVLLEKKPPETVDSEGLQGAWDGYFRHRVCA